jgi:hypothetical protein
MVGRMTIIENKKTNLCIYCWKRVKLGGFIVCKEHEDEWERLNSCEKRQGDNPLRIAIDKYWETNKLNEEVETRDFKR